MEDALEQIIRLVYRNWKAGRLKKFTEHPGDEEMAAFIEGRLSGSRSAGIKSHVVECDACGYLLAVRAKLPEGEGMEVPEELIRGLKATLGRILRPEALEIALKLKGGMLELLRTTGDVLLGREAVAAPLLRSRRIGDFKDEITILKDFDRLLVEIKIENKRGGNFSVTAIARDKKSSRAVKDVRATLMRDGVELESYAGEAGKVVFEHVSPGNYTIELKAMDGEPARVLLEMRG